jgi:hypothetical protein
MVMRLQPKQFSISELPESKEHMMIQWAESDRLSHCMKVQLMHPAQLVVHLLEQLGYTQVPDRSDRMLVLPKLL